MPHPPPPNRANINTNISIKPWNPWFSLILHQQPCGTYIVDLPWQTPHPSGQTPPRLLFWIWQLYMCCSFFLWKLICCSCLCCERTRTFIKGVEIYFYQVLGFLILTCLPLCSCECTINSKSLFWLLVLDLLRTRNSASLATHCYMDLETELI